MTSSTPTTTTTASSSEEVAPTMQQDLKGKLALVTGANSGIGKEATLQLAERGCTVVMCCRSMNKADEARTEIMQRLGLKDSQRLRLVQLDLSDLDNVRQFSVRYDAELPDLKDKPLDMTILNAGVMALPERELNKQGIEMQMATNVIGHYLLLSVLWNRIRAANPARVVLVGSQFFRLANGQISFEDFDRDKSYSPWTVYGETKLGTLLVLTKLNRLLEQRQRNNVIVVSAHPGYANTGIHRYTFAKFFSPLFGQSASTSAKSLVFGATDPQAQRNGYAGPRYLMQLYGAPTWSDKAPCKEMFDVAFQDKFWAKCEELTQAHLEDKL